MILGTGSMGMPAAFSHPGNATSGYFSGASISTVAQKKFRGNESASVAHSMRNATAFGENGTHRGYVDLVIGQVAEHAFVLQEIGQLIDVGRQPLRKASVAAS